MANWECPQEWSEWMKWLAVGLHGRCRWRLPILLLGVLFARGPRTVASWLRAAGIGRGFSGYYYFISAVGRKSKSVGTQLFSLLLLEVGPGRPAVVGSRRYSHQAVRPEGPGRRHPSQSHARTGRREVRLRPHLDNTVVGRAASAVGDDRAAPVGRTLCATQEHFGPAHTTRLGIPDEVATGRGPGGLGREDRLGRGKTAVGRRRRRLCQASVPQTTAETRRSRGQSPAKGCAPEHLAGEAQEGAAAKTRPAAKIRHQANQPGQTCGGSARLENHRVRAVWQAGRQAVQELSGHLPPGLRHDPRSDCPGSHRPTVPSSAPIPTPASPRFWKPSPIGRRSNKTFTTSR